MRLVFWMCFFFFLNFFPQFLQKYLILNAAVMSLPDERDVWGDAFDQTLKWSRARHVWMFGPRGQHKSPEFLAV